MYGSLSRRVILLFPLIYRMLIYLFPLLSIFIIFYILTGIMCLISLLQSLGFLPTSQNLFCSFAVTRACVILFIWMISWSLFALSGQVRGHACFVFLLVCLGLHINLSKLDLASLSPLLFWGCARIWSTCHYLYLMIS